MASGNMDVTKEDKQQQQQQQESLPASKEVGAQGEEYFYMPVERIDHWYLMNTRKYFWEKW